MHGASGKVAGFEALTYWQHLERGIVSPDEFIPLTEESALIVKIDRWVLKTAYAQLQTWLAINPELTLSVNFSGRQFAQAGLTPFIASVLGAFHLTPFRPKVDLPRASCWTPRPWCARPWQRSGSSE